MKRSAPGAERLGRVAGHRLRHELLLEHGVVAAVQEDVEPVLPLRRRVVVVGQREEVRLRRAVDPRIEPADAALGHPRRRGRASWSARSVPVASVCERVVASPWRAPAASVEPLVVLQRAPDRVEIDLDVGDAIGQRPRAVLLLSAATLPRARRRRSAASLSRPRRRRCRAAETGAAPADSARQGSTPQRRAMRRPPRTWRHKNYSFGGL